MNLYKENNCRLCKKVFCCKKCREKHEMLTHKIFVKCDICVYGKTTLTDPPEDLKNHITKRHWPLHCVLCKRFFGSWDEFLKQTNCQMENKMFEKIAYTPNQNENEAHYESPLYFPKEHLVPGNACMFSNLATSTPMQREENLAEKNNELVTPVDLSDINKGKKCFGESVSLQRRVTFYETPVMVQENIKKTEKLENRIIVTPCSENASTMFYSAKYTQENVIQTYQNRVSIAVENVSPNVEDMKHKIGPEDTTLWISALNTPSSSKKDEPVDQNSTTPFIAKLKKRQISVVVPTMVKKDGIELEALHSTGLNSAENNIPIVLHVPPRSNFFENITAEGSISSIKSQGTSEALSETSINAPQRLWTSVTRLVRNVTNVVQEFSNVSYTLKTPLKRSISEDSSSDGPNIKRYKLTEIKCRRPIRDLSTAKYSIEYDENPRLSSNNITVGIKKTFIDKATQTD